MPVLPPPPDKFFTSVGIFKCAAFSASLLITDITSHAGEPVVIGAKEPLLEDITTKSTPDYLSNIRLGYRIGFGPSVRFSERPRQINLARTSRSNTVSSSFGTAVPSDSGRYADGFVLTDSSGNAGGKTWNWGYSNNSQVSGDAVKLTRQTSLVRSSSTATRVTTDSELFIPTTHSGDLDNASHGVEIIYSKGLLSSGKLTVGFEAGFSFDDLSIDQRSRSRVPIGVRTREQIGSRTTFSGSNRFTTDSYALEGVVAPLAPYSGSFGTPGALLSDTPNASSTSSADIAPSFSSSGGSSIRNSTVPGTLDSRNEFDADIFSFRTGATFDFAVSERLTTTVAAGALLSVIDYEASYDETLSIPTFGEFSRSAETSGTEVMVIDSGYVVLELDSEDALARPVQCHSVSKSFLNALYGGLYAEGNLDLDQILADLAIRDRTPLPETESTAQLRHILQSRSGVYLPAEGETDEMKNRRPTRGSHPPGTFYYYNNWDFNAAGHIYEKLSGRAIYDAFDAQIAKPLEMQDFDKNKHAVPQSSDPSEGLSKFPAYSFKMNDFINNTLIPAISFAHVEYC